MNLGNSLFHARKKSGLSQEEQHALEALLDKLADHWDQRPEAGLGRAHHHHR